MPLGILSEVYFGLPPILVLIGAISMTTSVIWLGVEFFSLKSIKTK
jgi:Zn-dependent membrane protease YugP